MSIKQTGKPLVQCSKKHKRACLKYLKSIKSRFKHLKKVQIRFTSKRLSQTRKKRHLPLSQAILFLLPIKGNLFANLRSSIKLDKNNKAARQSGNSSERFVLVTEGLGVKHQKISFQVTQLKNWVGIGIGIRNNLQNQKYAFNCKLFIIQTQIQDMEATYFQATGLPGRIRKKTII